MFNICMSRGCLLVEETRIDLLIEDSPFLLPLYLWVFQPQAIIRHGGYLHFLWEEEQSEIIALDDMGIVNYSLVWCIYHICLKWYFSNMKHNSLFLCF